MPAQHKPSLLFEVHKDIQKTKLQVSTRDAHFGLKWFIGTGSLRISFSASSEPCNTVKQHYELQVLSFASYRTLISRLNRITNS